VKEIDTEIIVSEMVAGYARFIQCYLTASAPCRRIGTADFR